MENHENERPVSSGLDEIFGNGGAVGVSSDENESSREDRREKREGGRRRRNRRDRRHRRRSGDGEETLARNAPELTDEAVSEDVSEDEDFPLEEDQAEEEFSSYDDEGVTVTEVTLRTESPEKCEIVGVRFKDTGKTYYFDPGNLTLKKGDCAIVDTSRGLEFAYVSVGNSFVPVSAIVPPLRSVIRAATDEDRKKQEENTVKEKEAFGICLEKIRDHELEMKLIDAEYTFDQSKLTFYFSADGRVDFRELVKDLAGVFRTRIELRQIGIRDEAKLIGGLGVCGRPFCCSTFLSDFVQVSIKMAKEQNLSLNSAKISGACGRLMCCLRYEHDTYAEEIKKTPAVGKYVKTADGVGVVVESSPLLGKIKVRIGDEQNSSTKEYSRDDVTIVQKN